ncbi:MAG: hypothetical protein OMM_09790 [Candidatus Magnetoglobus multicellularis str. Araruama]|uniref:Uncharacterized protein n=1 Tax=Candidatus Magnetoglobus multicellularis str. Araruama TaxID=890399 RepID=A0A1V1P2U9_9BACT|nr:MAG: hypothetical protein OMM_09790 [Candidatus Magnetoglobus multicellularis str. Araruama]
MNDLDKLEKKLPKKISQILCKIASQRIGWLVDIYKKWADLHNEIMNIGHHKRFIKIVKRYKVSQKNVEGYSEDAIARFVDGKLTTSTNCFA